MKITRNIWRRRNVSTIRDERHRNLLYTFGAIIEYKNGVIFVDLDRREDEAEFDKYIAENDMNDIWTIEDNLPSHFATEDYDPEYYSYSIAGGMEDFTPEK